MSLSSRCWLLLVLSIPLSGCCCGAYSTGYGYGYSSPCGPPAVNPCYAPAVNPCGPPQGCGIGHHCGTGCCLFDSIWGTFRAIDQWKCDCLGCCMFGVTPSYGAGYGYGGGFGGGYGGYGNCCSPGGFPAPISPGCCDQGGFGTPAMGYPAW